MNSENQPNYSRLVIDAAKLLSANDKVCTPGGSIFVAGSEALCMKPIDGLEYGKLYLVEGVVPQYSRLIIRGKHYNAERFTTPEAIHNGAGCVVTDQD